MNDQVVVDQRPDLLAQVLKDAADIAVNRWGAQRYNTFHILLAVMRHNRFLREWLETRGVRFNELMARAAQLNAIADVDIGQVLAMARQIAQSRSVPRHPIHLIYGILNYPGSVAGRLLAEHFDLNAAKREIVRSQWLGTFPDASVQDQGQSLAGMGTDLTQRAREGKIRPVYGRDEEISQVVEILARRDPSLPADEAINNPVLLGSAGVGKSAIAKGLALSIVRREPLTRLFHNFRVVYVSFGELQAGTGVRGSIEARVEALLRECREGPPTILFLDELHVIMGLGRTEGSSGIDELLKPALAEGLTCIGATTTEEWRQQVERKNAAFARRWIPVIVDEPDLAGTIRILDGCVDDLARRHLVHFPSDVLVGAANMGREYMPQEASPAREIERVLNGVGAKLKIAGRTDANQTDVAEIVSALVGYPVRVEDEDRARFLQAPAILGASIKGQDEANRALADGVIRFASGMRDSAKPLVILALGPTGVGKTHSAQVLAKTYWNGRLFRIDMSEYMERHTVSRLVGAPPGYVGFDGEGQLTRQLQTLGKGVCLLDEIEKAHGDVVRIFLQLFDDGRLTDSHGKTADGRKFVFVMTSNLGAGHFFEQRTRGIGFTADQDTGGEIPFAQIRERVIADAKAHFAPELWNRIDEVLVYKPLDREALRSIAVGLLESEKAKCATKGFTLAWDDAVVDYLVRHGFDPANGARPMKRVIMRRVQTLLAVPILANEISSGDTIELALAGGSIVWRKRPT